MIYEESEYSMMSVLLTIKPTEESAKKFILTCPKQDGIIYRYEQVEITE